MSAQRHSPWYLPHYSISKLLRRLAWKLKPNDESEAGAPFPALGPKLWNAQPGDNTSPYQYITILQRGENSNHHVSIFVNTVKSVIPNHLYWADDVFKITNEIVRNIAAPVARQTFAPQKTGIMGPTWGPWTLLSGAGYSSDTFSCNQVSVTHLKIGQS